MCPVPREAVEISSELGGGNITTLDFEAQHFEGSAEAMSNSGQTPPRVAETAIA